MANTITAQFDYNANFGPVIGQMQQLTTQANILNNTLQNLDKQAVGLKANIAQAFASDLGKIGGWNGKMIELTDSVDNFGQALLKQKLTLKQYASEAIGAFSQASNAHKLAVREVSREMSQLVTLGKDMNGKQMGMMITPATINLKDFNTQMAVSRKQWAIFNSLVQDGSTHLINFGKNTQWAGRQITVGLTVPLTMYGNAVSKIFREVDAELTRFQKVYGGDLMNSTSDATKQMVDDVRNLAVEFSKSMGIAAKDTASLAADLAATGLEGQKLLASIRETTRLAVLGDVSNQDAMKTTLSLQNAFKMSTDELSQSVNFLNAVENQTSLSLQDLTTAIPKAGPVIKALGGDVKDLSLLMVALKEGGISAAEGANALKSGLASLTNPTKKATQVAKQYGIDINQIVQANRGQLMPTIIAFQQQLSLLDDFGKAQVIENVFGKYQFARISALFDNLNASASQTNQVLGLMGKSNKELAATAYQEMDTLMNSSSKRFQRATEGIKAQFLTIGGSITSSITPILESITGKIGKAIKFFEDMPKPIKSFIKVATGLTAVAGPIIMMVGIFSNFMGYVSKGAMGIVNLGRRMAGVPVEKFQMLEDTQLMAQKATQQLANAFDVERSSVERLNQALMIYKQNLSEAITLNPAFMNQQIAVHTTTGNPPVAKFQTGGSAWVPGSGNGDRIPAMLEPGEYVVNKKAAAKHSSLLDNINFRQAPRFQSGGEVGSRRADEQSKFIGPLPDISYEVQGTYKGGGYTPYADYPFSSEEKAREFARTDPRKWGGSGSRITSQFNDPNQQAYSAWIAGNTSAFRTPGPKDMVHQQAQSQRQLILNKMAPLGNIALSRATTLEYGKHLAEFTDQMIPAKILFALNGRGKLEDLIGQKIQWSDLQSFSTKPNAGQYGSYVANSFVKGTPDAQSKVNKQVEEGAIRAVLFRFANAQGREGFNVSGAAKIQNVFGKPVSEQEYILNKPSGIIQSIGQDIKTKMGIVNLMQNGGRVQSHADKSFNGNETVEQILNSWIMSGMGSVRNSSYASQKLQQSKSPLGRRLNLFRGTSIGNGMEYPLEVEKLLLGAQAGTLSQSDFEKLFVLMQGNSSLGLVSTSSRRLDAEAFAGRQTDNPLLINFAGSEQSKTIDLNKVVPQNSFQNEHILDPRDFNLSSIASSYEGLGKVFGIENYNNGSDSEKRKIREQLLNRNLRLSTPEAVFNQRLQSHADKSLQINPSELQSQQEAIGKVMFRPRAFDKKTGKPSSFELTYLTGEGAGVFLDTTTLGREKSFIDRLMATSGSEGYVVQLMALAEQLTQSHLGKGLEFPVSGGPSLSPFSSRLAGNLLGEKINKTFSSKKSPEHLKEFMNYGFKNYNRFPGGLLDLPDRRIALQIVKEAAERIKQIRAAEYQRYESHADTSMPPAWAEKQKGIESILAATHEEATSGRFAGMPLTDVGTRTSDMGGFSSLIPGANGVYEINGKKYVVKSHSNAESALIESRGTQLTRDIFGLETPIQEFIKFAHPNTGQTIFGVRSPFDSKFANPTGQVGPQDFFMQALSAIIRGDSDLQPDNLFGNIVGDVGAAYVSDRAAQPRGLSGKRADVATQAKVNFLMMKGGAKKWFTEVTAGLAASMSPEQYEAGFQGAISQALAKAPAAIAGLGNLTPKEQAMYQTIISDLEASRGLDWKGIHAHHVGVTPAPKRAPAVLTAKTLEKKALEKQEKQQALAAGFPEWMMTGRVAQSGFSIPSAAGGMGKQSKSLVTTFARMNPPHAGHGILLDAASAWAKSHGSDFKFDLSQKEGDEKNPLSLNDKYSLFRAMFPQYAGNLQPPSAGTKISDKVQGWVDSGYTSADVFLGEDQAGKFQNFLPRTGEKLGIRTSVHTVGRPEGAMSATALRAAIQSGDLNTIMSFIPGNLPPEQRQAIANKLSEISIPQPIKRTSKKASAESRIESHADSSFSDKLGRTPYIPVNAFYQMLNYIKAKKMVKRGLYHGSSDSSDGYLEGDNVLEDFITQDPYFGGMGFFSTTSKEEADLYKSGYNIGTDLDSSGSMNAVTGIPFGKYVDLRKPLKRQNYDLWKALSESKDGAKISSAFGHENLNDAMRSSGVIGAMLDRIAPGGKTYIGEIDNAQWLAFANPTGVKTSQMYQNGGRVNSHQEKSKLWDPRSIIGVSPGENRFFNQISQGELDPRLTQRIIQNIQSNKMFSDSSKRDMLRAITENINPIALRSQKAFSQILEELLMSGAFTGVPDRIMGSIVASIIAPKKRQSESQTLSEIDPSLTPRFAKKSPAKFKSARDRSYFNSMGVRSDKPEDKIAWTRRLAYAAVRDYGLDPALIPHIMFNLGHNTQAKSGVVADATHAFHPSIYSGRTLSYADNSLDEATMAKYKEAQRRMSTTDYGDDFYTGATSRNVLQDWAQGDYRAVSQSRYAADLLYPLFQPLGRSTNLYRKTAAGTGNNLSKEFTDKLKLAFEGKLSPAEFEALFSNPVTFKSNMSSYTESLQVAKDFEPERTNLDDYISGKLFKMIIARMMNPQSESLDVNKHLPDNRFSGEQEHILQSGQASLSGIGMTYNPLNPEQLKQYLTTRPEYKEGIVRRLRGRNMYDSIPIAHFAQKGGRINGYADQSKDMMQSPRYYQALSNGSDKNIIDYLNLVKDFGGANGAILGIQRHPSNKQKFYINEAFANGVPQTAIIELLTMARKLIQERGQDFSIGAMKTFGSYSNDSAAMLLSLERMGLLDLTEEERNQLSPANTGQYLSDISENPIDRNNNTKGNAKRVLEYELKKYRSQVDNPKFEHVTEMFDVPDWREEFLKQKQIPLLKQSGGRVQSHADNSLEVRPWEKKAAAPKAYSQVLRNLPDWATKGAEGQAILSALKAAGISDADRTAGFYLQDVLAHINPSTTNTGDIYEKVWEAANLMKDSQVYNVFLETINSRKDVGGLLNPATVARVIADSGLSASVAQLELTKIADGIHPTTANGARVMMSLSRLFPSRTRPAITTAVAAGLGARLQGNFYDTLQSRALPSSLPKVTVRSFKEGKPSDATSRSQGSRVRSTGLQMPSGTISPSIVMPELRRLSGFSGGTGTNATVKVDGHGNVLSNGIDDMVAQTITGRQIAVSSKELLAISPSGHIAGVTSPGDEARGKIIHPVGTALMRGKKYQQARVNGYASTSLTEPVFQGNMDAGSMANFMSNIGFLSSGFYTLQTAFTQFTSTTQEGADKFTKLASAMNLAITSMQGLAQVAAQNGMQQKLELKSMKMQGLAKPKVDLAGNPVLDQNGNPVYSKSRVKAPVGKMSSGFGKLLGTGSKMLGFLGGPMGQLGVSVAISALNKGIEMYQKAVGQAKAAGRSMFNDPIEGAKLLGITLKDTSNIAQTYSKIATGLGMKGTGKGAYDKVYADVVKKDYGDLIDNLKIVLNQEEKRNKLMLTYISLRQKGFSVNDAKDYVKEIARQSGAMSAFNSVNFDSMKKTSDMANQTVASTKALMSTIGKVDENMYGKFINKKTGVIYDNLDQVKKAFKQQGAMQQLTSTLNPLNFNDYGDFTEIGKNTASELNAGILSSFSSLGLNEKQLGEAIAGALKTAYSIAASDPAAANQAGAMIIKNIADGTKAQQDAANASILDMLKEMGASQGDLGYSFVQGGGLENMAKDVENKFSGMGPKFANAITSAIQSGNIDLVNEMLAKSNGEPSPEVMQDFTAKLAKIEALAKIQLEVNIQLDQTKKQLEDIKTQISSTFDKVIASKQAEITLEDKRHEKALQNLDDEGKRLSDKKDVLQRNTDYYIKELQREKEAEDYYANQRKTGLSGLKAISQGDVFGLIGAQMEAASSADQFGRDRSMQAIQDTSDLAQKKLDEDLRGLDNRRAAEDARHKSEIDNINAEIEFLNKKRSVAIGSAESAISKIEKVSAMSPSDPGYAKAVKEAMNLASTAGLQATNVLKNVDTSKMTKQELIDFEKTKKDLGLAIDAFTNDTSTALDVIGKNIEPIVKNIQDSLGASGDILKGVVEALNKPVAKNSAIAKVAELAGIDTGAANGTVNGAPTAGNGPVATNTVTAPKTTSTTRYTGAANAWGRTMATGGLLSGPGTGTSDSIPARLSNGEFVMRADAVRKYGIGAMNAINAGRFATGGFVGNSVPSASTYNVPSAGVSANPSPVAQMANGGMASASVSHTSPTQNFNFNGAGMDMVMHHVNKAVGGRINSNSRRIG